MSRYCWLFGIWLLLGAKEVLAQQVPSPVYVRKEAMVPVRDGVRLHTVIYHPGKPDDSLPFLLLRTPYGTDRYGDPLGNPVVKEMAEEGYIFVYQDIRGKYQSEGTFEMLRAMRDRSDPNAIDESTDAWDTIDWLLENVPGHNGKVGMYGISYPGWTTIMGAMEPHPALVAASEQASPADMFLGDDFFHNGAFRLSYGFEYAYRTENSKVDSHFPFGQYDTYEWYLKLGPLSNVNKKYFHHRIPTWNNFVRHPTYDEFWQKQALAHRLDYPRIPIQHVGGWWDQEDLYGPQKAYELLEARDSSDRNFLVLGPWNHGGWVRGDGRSLGKIAFRQPTADTFRMKIQAPWFAYHLKGKGEGRFPEAVTFQTGSNQWKSYEQWPPSAAVQKKLYLHANGKLSFKAPEDEEPVCDSYLSDPAYPVPYRMRPVEATYGPGSRWSDWMVGDQRFVHRRPDVRSWTSDVLTEDVTVTGKVLARLFAATTGSDADWVVKLIDVYPDEYPEKPEMSGYQLMITGDVLRGRFRNSFEEPEPVLPDVVEEYTLNLHHINHVFRKGHRIMVQVQSSWFPLIDRNPQQYVPNIFEAKESDFQQAVHKIYRNKSQASCLELPVAE